MNSTKKAVIIIMVVFIIIGIILMIFVLSHIGFKFLKRGDANFETKTYEVDKQFKNINIIDVEATICIEPSDNTNCKVLYSDGKEINHSIDVYNDTLTITRIDTRHWYERISIFGDDDLTLTVYLPKKDYDNLFVKTVSGEIKVAESLKFKNAELYTTSGDIDAMLKESKDLTVKSVSGDIFIKDLLCGPLEVSTTSGDIELANITVSRLNTNTTSGDTELSSVFVSGNVALNAVSGDIEFDDTDAKTLNIKTVSGSVLGRLLSSKNFIINTTSGDVYVPESDPFSGDCEIKTTSGDIKILILV